MDKPKKGEKLYAVQCVVFAKSATQAMNKAKKLPVTEVFIIQDWQKHNIDQADAIGFIHNQPNEED